MRARSVAINKYYPSPSYSSQQQQTTTPMMMEDNDNNNNEEQSAETTPPTTTTRRMGGENEGDDEEDHMAVEDYSVLFARRANTTNTSQQQHYTTSPTQQQTTTSSGGPWNWAFLKGGAHTNNNRRASQPPQQQTTSETTTTTTTRGGVHYGSGSRMAQWFVHWTSRDGDMSDSWRRRGLSMATHSTENTTTTMKQPTAVTTISRGVSTPNIIMSSPTSPMTFTATNISSLLLQPITSPPSHQQQQLMPKQSPETGIGSISFDRRRKKFKPLSSSSPKPPPLNTQEEEEEQQQPSQQQQPVEHLSWPKSLNNTPRQQATPQPTGAMSDILREWLRRKAGRFSVVIAGSHNSPIRPLLNTILQSSLISSSSMEQISSPGGGYFIPEGQDFPPHLCSVKYGEIPEATVRFISDQELTDSLTHLHQAQQNLCPIEPEYRSYLQSRSLTADSSSAIGTSIRFKGMGESVDSDRVFVRDNVLAVLKARGPLIAQVSFCFPSSLLLEGSRELHIATDKDTWEPVTTSSMQNLIHNAALLALAVNGDISEDLERLVRSSFFLPKFLSQPEQNRLIVMDLQSKEQTTTTTEWLQKRAGLIRQLQGMFARTPVGPTNLPPDQRAIEKATSELCLFQIINTADDDNLAALICAIKNTTLVQCAEELRDFSDSWMLRTSSSSRESNLASWPLTAAAAAATSTSSSSSSGNIDQLADTFTRTLTVGSSGGSSSGSGKRMTNTMNEQQQQSSELLGVLDQRFTAIRSCVVDITAIESTLSQQQQQQRPLKSFSEAVSACRRRSRVEWPGFRDTYLTTAEACQMILNPVFEGECLGANLCDLMFSQLIQFAVAFWKEAVVPNLLKTEENLTILLREVIGKCAKLSESRRMSAYERLQYRQFVWQCQDSSERVLSAVFRKLKQQLASEGLEDNTKLITSIIKQTLVTTCLSRCSSSTVSECQRIVEESCQHLPSQCASAIQAVYGIALCKIVAPALDSFYKHLTSITKALLSQQYDPSFDFSSNNNTSSTTTTTAMTSLASVEVLRREEFMAEQSSMIVRVLSNEQSVQTTAEQQQQFEQSLKTQGLKLLNTSDNNNSSSSSQFRSLAQLLYNTEDAHTVIRLLVVLEILLKKDLYQPLLLQQRRHHHSNTAIDGGCEVQLYTGRMSQEDVPGDHITLFAFAAFSRVDILLYSPVLSRPLLIPAPRRSCNQSHSRLSSGKSLGVTTGPIIRLALCSGNVYRPILPMVYSETQESQTPQTQQQPTITQQQTMTAEATAKNRRTVASLVDICVGQVAKNVCEFPANTPQALPEDIISKIIRRVVTDHSTDAVDFDLILFRLLHQGVCTLDLSHSRHVTKYSLVEATSTCPNLHTVSLANCTHITDDCVSVLVTSCSGIRSLNLESCRLLTDTSMESISRNARNLQSLNISFCTRITSAGVASLRQLSGSLRLLELRGLDQQLTDSAFQGYNNTALQLLDLSSTSSSGLTDRLLTCCLMIPSQLVAFKITHAKQITDSCLGSFFVNCPLLEVVDLSGCSQVSNLSLHSLFSSARRLRRLSLVGCSLVTDTSFPCVMDPTSLEVLSLAGCSSITDQLITRLPTITPHIYTLNLTSCVQLTDTALSHAMSSLQQLRKLHVNKCPKLSDAPLCELAQKSSCALKQVSFSCTSVTNLTLSALSVCCGGGNSLKLVDCSQCQHVSDEGVIRLVKTCSALEVLSLEGCVNVSDLSISSLVQYNNNRLKTLRIGYCTKLTDLSLSSLAHLSSLQNLDMSYCNITTRGIHALLSGSCHLVALQLRGIASGGGGGSSGAAAAAGILNRVYPSLQHVNLAWSRLSMIDAIVKDFTKFLPSLTTLNLTRCAGLTDATVRLLATDCHNLQHLNVAGCPSVVPATVSILVLGGISVSQ